MKKIELEDIELKVIGQALCKLGREKTEIMQRVQNGENIPTEDVMDAFMVATVVSCLVDKVVACLESEVKTVTAKAHKTN